MSEFEKVVGRLIDIIVQAVDSEKDDAKIEMYNDMLDYIGILIGIDQRRK